MNDLSSKNPPKILIVDDFPQNRYLLQQMLKTFGLKGEEFEGGEAVVRYCKEHSVDFILMDINMPEVDGFEATRRIRLLENERESQKRVFIIAVTANAMFGNRETILENGFDDYLEKPLKIYDLKTKLLR